MLGACALQLLCRKCSLSGLDRLILSLFFIWGILSVLIGGIVGGSILTYLSPDFISNPGMSQPLSPWSFWSAGMIAE